MWRISIQQSGVHAAVRCGITVAVDRVAGAAAYRTSSGQVKIHYDVIQVTKDFIHVYLYFIDSSLRSYSGSDSSG